MQVCIADLKRKDQKDGAHDNLIMTSGSKFGMPVFQVADQVISKFCVPAAGTAIATDVYSLSSDLAHWLTKGLHQPSGKQFKIASYIQAKEYLIDYIATRL